eukprot:480961-Prorocentrum_minimum.AAC.1
MLVPGHGVALHHRHRALPEAVMAAIAGLRRLAQILVRPAPPNRTLLSATSAEAHTPAEGCGEAIGRAGISGTRYTPQIVLQTPLVAPARTPKSPSEPPCLPPRRPAAHGDGSR